MRITILALLLLCWQATAWGQQEFKADLELRPRTEWRKGYRTLPSDTSHAAFFTTQRTRLNLDMKHPGLKAYVSLQDIRLWGKDDPRSTGGTFQVFEAYVEPTLWEKWSVRIGRQRVMYDNQRLFAQNDWRQNAGAHDGMRLIYQSDKLQAEWVAAFNQTQENLFGTYFTPSGFSNYKALGVFYAKYKASEALTLQTINAYDGFQGKTDNGLNGRITQGGRVEYEKGPLYLTLSGYYQYGKTPKGEQLSAFYAQPEVKWKPSKKLTFRLGAEWMSGDKPGKDGSQSFVALYGVAHRFNGYIDFFTNFPSDLGNAGLVNPYFFTILQATEKFSARVDHHLFYSHQAFSKSGLSYDKYLGFEQDWLFNYNPNKQTKLELGLCWLKGTPSLEAIKGGNSNITAWWSYLMITFTPELFSYKKEPKKD